MKVLVVWEEIPECLIFYEIDMTTEEYESIKEAAGTYLRSSLENLQTKRLAASLYEKEYFYNDDSIPPGLNTWPGKFVETMKELDINKPIDISNFDKLIHSGIML